MELIRGTLDVLILHTLRQGPRHGYAICRAIRERSQEALRVEEGALYPALRRLEKKGLLASHWDVSETGRQARFYRLTERGRRRLEDAVADWRRYVDAMKSVLEAGPDPAGR